MKFLSLMVFIPMMVWGKTHSSFVDSCSKEQIRVATPNGTGLQVEIVDLDPKEDLELTVTFRLAGIVDQRAEDTATFNFLYKKKFLQAPFKTLINLPKTKWMKQVEQRHSDNRIWDADLSWIQPRSKKAGYALTSFYHAPNKGPYFQLRSEGICHWEEPAKVSSKLYENNSDAWMSVSRETSQTWERGPARGVTLGYNNNTGGNLPLAPSIISNTVYGWFFKDWQNQMGSQHIYRLERKYQLTPKEAGVFVSHLTFTRHEVDRVVWKQTSRSCGQFVTEEKGYLDVGVLSEDFIVIPRTYYGREEKLANYIQTVRPPLSSCPSSVGSGPEFADDVIPSGESGILFYYKNFQNQGEI